jgi:hypothetical protein
VVGGAFLMAGFGRPGKSDAAGCAVSDKLVNSCRPWVGAAANNYPQAADNTKSQILFHEQRIGRQLDIVHTYHPVGKNSLNDTDKFFAARTNTYLFANWKPADKWKDATGANSATTAGIDQMAASVKSVGPAKIFMTLHHEPENDVSGGASGCSSYKGAAGTPADYRNMWRYVRDRFNAKGVNNVVWVMDYMNYGPWDCMVDDLYPGNDLVDWVMYNGYATTPNWQTNVSRFQNVLKGYQSTSLNFASKPQGIVEWSISMSKYTTAQQTDYFDQVNNAIKNGTFPSLKTYMIYDSRDKGADNGESSRVGYDAAGNYSANSQAHYNAIVNTIASMTAPPVPLPAPPSNKDTIPPVVTLTSPANGATVSGKIQVTGTASDNKKVKAVTLRVDDQWVATDEAASYQLTLDTTKYKDGKHSVVLRVWDSSDNMGQSKTVTLNFNNKKSGPVQTKPPVSTSNVIENKPSDTAGTSKPITASGTLIFTPSIFGNSVQVWVNGKLQRTNTIDTTNLTNGIHKVQVVENGLVSSRLVSVNNPPLLAVLNDARANVLLYGGGFVLIFGSLGVYFGRSYVTGIISRREARVVRAQRRVK